MVKWEWRLQLHTVAEAVLVSRNQGGNHGECGSLDRAHNERDDREEEKSVACLYEDGAYQNGMAPRSGGRRRRREWASGGTPCMRGSPKSTPAGTVKRGTTVERGNCHEEGESERLPRVLRLFVAHGGASGYRPRTDGRTRTRMYFVLT